MKVKALKSFIGKISMNVNEVKEILDKNILDDLIKAKFVEPIKEEIKKVEVKIEKAEQKNEQPNIEKPKKQNRKKNKLQ